MQRRDLDQVRAARIPAEGKFLRRGREWSALFMTRKDGKSKEDGLLDFFYDSCVCIVCVRLVLPSYADGLLHVARSFISVVWFPYMNMLMV